MHSLFRNLFLAAAVAAAGALASSGAVRPASVVGSNMVLQQQAQAPLWGWATPGVAVTVTPSWPGARPVTARAGADGRWQLALETPAASYTPYTIEISEEGEPAPLLLDNVLVGEVWLASGQSNMAMPLEGYFTCPLTGGQDEIALAGQRAGRVRVFTGPEAQSLVPQDTLKGRWEVPSPRTAAHFSATAWHFAKRLNDVLDVPVGIVAIPYSGTRVEGWLPREILREVAPEEPLDSASLASQWHSHRPMVFYNALFNPVVPYAVNGIIWYQGCSNVGSDATYASRLGRMVEHWRQRLGRGDIPFYQVEIAPFEYGGDQRGRAAALRRAQLRAADSIPNAGLVGITDLVRWEERSNIHPSDKEDVGKRLAQMALNRAYGYGDLFCTYPRITAVEYPGDGTARATVECSRFFLTRNSDVTGFEVAGDDGVFHPADKVRVANGRPTTVTVSSSEVPLPRAFRYNYCDFPRGNAAGEGFLPLRPFSDQ